jgi:AraC-like DNA-binding protein
MVPTALDPADTVTVNALDHVESKRSAKRRRGRERAARRLTERLEIVERVASGENYAAIAADLGRSESSVRERFLREMERTATVTENARQLALMRLECLLRQWFEEAIRDDDDSRKAFVRASRATREVLRIMDQEHRLQGLYR